MFDKKKMLSLAISFILGALSGFLGQHFTLDEKAIEAGEAVGEKAADVVEEKVSQ